MKEYLERYNNNVNFITKDDLMLYRSTSQITGRLEMTRINLVLILGAINGWICCVGEQHRVAFDQEDGQPLKEVPDLLRLIFTCVSGKIFFI